METTIMGCIGLYRGYIGIKENKMEIAMLYWGYIGIIHAGAQNDPDREELLAGSIYLVALQGLVGGLKQEVIWGLGQYF